MAKINDEIIKFVEDGIFESGKAYMAIRYFEEYLKDVFKDLLSNYNWDMFEIKPNLNNLNFNTSSRKSIGDYFSCNLQLETKNGIKKTIVLTYNSSTIGLIRIHGRWNGEKDIEYKDYDNLIKPRVADIDGIKLDIVLEEKDKLKFSFKDYYTMILDVLTKHSDQLK